MNTSTHLPKKAPKLANKSVGASVSEVQYEFILKKASNMNCTLSEFILLALRNQTKMPNLKYTILEALRIYLNDARTIFDIKKKAEIVEAIRVIKSY